MARVAARAEVGRVQPHDFRRALATHLVARGVSVLAVADLLGHADLGAAEAYIGCNELALRGAVERLLGDR